jgi:hypothetical protein
VNHISRRLFLLAAFTNVRALYNAGETYRSDHSKRSEKSSKSRSAILLMEDEFDYVRSFSRSSEQVPALALRVIADRLSLGWDEFSNWLSIPMHS